MGILGLWALIDFPTFVNSHLLVKLYFSLGRGRRLYAEPRKLLCHIFFALVYHRIYISPEIIVTRILVIGHPSAAYSLSNRGWNSTMKSLGQRSSLSFLCWPYFVDQYQNRNYICDVLENRLTTLSPTKRDYNKTRNFKESVMMVLKLTH